MSITRRRFPKREEILAELEKFKNLSLNAKKEGVIDNYLVYEQGRNVISALKLFVDIVPELNELQ